MRRNWWFTACLLLVSGIIPRAQCQLLRLNSRLIRYETQGEITINFAFAVGTNSIVTVDFATEDIDAEAGRDYQATRGTLSFPAWQTIGVIRIPILDDGLVERNETFRLRLSNPSAGLSLPEDNTLVISIMDNEIPASLDEDFNSGVFRNPRSVVRMPDGRLVLMFPSFGTDNETIDLIRLHPDGSEDAGFQPKLSPPQAPMSPLARSGSGTRARGTDGGTEVLEYLQWISPHGADGLLVLISEPTPDCDDCARLVRLKSDGGPDNTFSVQPQLRLNVRPFPVVLPDGKIIVSTPDKPGQLARLNADGSLDATFVAASVGGPVGSILALPDQSLILKTPDVPNENIRARLIRLKTDGSLDHGFKVPLEFTWVSQITAGNAGKLYVNAGIWNGKSEILRVIRLNSDGSLDEAFSKVEYPHLTAGGFSLIGIEATGQILGYWSGGIVRLKEDGAIDRSYIAANVSWLDESPLSSVLLLPDGKLLLWPRGIINGHSDVGLVRIDPAKASRTFFQLEHPRCETCRVPVQVAESDGHADVRIRRLGDTTKPAAVRIATKSKIALAGSDFEPLNTTVSFSPLETAKIASASIIDDYNPEPEETLELMLTSQEGRSYGNNGSWTVEIRDNDRIGSKEQRYRPLHESGLSGIIGMQADGKLLVTHFDYTAPDVLKISRLNSSGQPDPDWREALIPFEPAFGWKASLEPDGKIYLVGDIRIGLERNWDLLRLNPDGTIDTSFRAIIPKFPAAKWQMRQSVASLAVMPDGRILVAVNPEDAPTNEGMIHHIIRLLADGSVDPTFASLKVIAYALKLTPAAEGRIWLTGRLHTVNDTPRRAIVRLNGDGSVDESFSLPLVVTEDFTHEVSSHLRLSDGSFLFAGKLQFTNETSPRLLIRLSPGGRFDSAFAPRIEGVAPYIVGLAQQPDGRILLAGSFEMIGSTSRTNLARLHLDGSIDSTFDSGPQARDLPGRILVRPDGQIIVENEDRTWDRFNGDRRLAMVAQPAGSGAFQMQLISNSDQTVVIEASESLLLPEWRPISTNAVTAKAPVKFTDPDELKSLQRFYRAVAN